jgi:ABC-type Fe3+-hydroxamate transport system substrate-binding protein
MIRITRMRQRLAWLLALSLLALCLLTACGSRSNAQGASTISSSFSAPTVSVQHQQGAPADGNANNAGIQSIDQQANNMLNAMDAANNDAQSNSGGASADSPQMP